MCCRVLFLLYGSFKNKTGIKRRQAQYIFIAHVILFFAGLDYFSRVLNLVPFPPLDDYIIVLYFVIFAYAIIKYRAMDIQTIIHKTAAWLTASSLVAVPLFGIFYMGHSWIGTLPQGLQSLLFALTGLLVIPYVRFLMPRIDQFFGRRKYHLQTVSQSFIRKIAVLNNPSDLISQACETVSSVLYPEGISFILLDREKETERLFSLDSSFPLEEHVPFLKWLEARNMVFHGESFFIDPEYDLMKEAAMAYTLAVSAEVIVPFIHNGKLVGVMNLGANKNLQVYSQDVINFLSNLKIEMSIALSNSLLYDEICYTSEALRTLNREMDAKVAEKTADLTKGKQELETAYQKLTEYDDLKSRFFANISHELRTPTTFILGPAEMLINQELGAVNAEQEKYLRAIHRNGTRLLNIINRLLDMMKSEVGSIELAYQRSDFVAFVKDIVASVLPSAEKKALTLTFSAEDAIPDFFSIKIRWKRCSLTCLGTHSSLHKRGALPFPVQSSLVLSWLK